MNIRKEKKNAILSNEDTILGNLIFLLASIITALYIYHISLHLISVYQKKYQSTQTLFQTISSLSQDRTLPKNLVSQAIHKYYCYQKKFLLLKMGIYCVNKDKKNQNMQKDSSPNQK